MAANDIPYAYAEFQPSPPKRGFFKAAYLNIFGFYAVSAPQLTGIASDLRSLHLKSLISSRHVQRALKRENLSRNFGYVLSHPHLS